LNGEKKREDSGIEQTGIRQRGDSAHAAATALKYFKDYW